MPNRKVSLVVDGSIELSAEQINSLGIFVVPRPATIAGKQVELNGTMPAGDYAWNGVYSKVSLKPPSVEDYAQIYRSTLASSEGIISIHHKPRFDSGLPNARLARNLLWPHSIFLLELDQMGIGAVKVIEFIAQIANLGWDLEMILALYNLYQRYSDTYFITRWKGTQQQTNLFQTDELPNRLKSLFRPHFLLTQFRSDAEDGRLTPQHIDQDLLSMVSNFAETFQFANKGATQKVSMRCLNFDEQFSEIEQLLASNKISYSLEKRVGGSAMLGAHFGQAFIEFSLTPKPAFITEQIKDLVRQIQAVRTNSQKPNKMIHQYRLRALNLV